MTMRTYKMKRQVYVKCNTHKNNVGRFNSSKFSGEIYLRSLPVKLYHNFLKNLMKIVRIKNNIDGEVL